MNFKKTQMAVAVASVMSLVVGNLALAQAAPAERVTVTGSNIKRSNIEGSSPIETITAKDIKLSGAKTVLELMKTVTALGADGYNDNTAQNSFSSGVATASLRSLSASSTLILINGRRMTPSAYANPNNGTSTLYDLNSIPLSAIERVEIFKDGASAVYGSDAIGGVINFITKTDYQGLEVNVTNGMNDDGEFGKRSATISAGFGDLKTDGWNFLVSGDFRQTDRTKMKDGSNDIQQDQYNQVNLRLNPFSSSLSKYPVFYKENGTAPLVGAGAKPNGNKNFPTLNNTNPAAVVLTTTNGCPADRLLTVTAVTGPQYGLAASSPLNGKSFCNFDLDAVTDLTTKGTDNAFFGRGTLRLGSATSAFTELAYSKSERTYTAPARTIDGLSATSFSFNAAGILPAFQAILPIGHPDNPFNADAVPRSAAVRYRFENHPGGTDLVNEQYRVLLGVKGTVGTWDWETAALWNRTERQETRHGFLNLTLLKQLIDPLVMRSLASLDADPNISPNITTNAFADIMQYDGKVATEFGELAGGPIGFAAGVEFRKERLNITADPLHASGQIFGFATTQQAGERNVQSGFFEFRTPWLKNFEMDFAGRFDSYPGIKTNFVPKVGAKWTVTDSLVLRGTYAEGFRAPAVSQIAPGGAQFFLNGLIDPLRCEDDGVTPKPNGGQTTDCNKTVGGVGGQNPNLKPETSKSWSIGAIYSPTSTIDVLLDAFRIRKEQEVALTDGQSVIDNPQNYPANYLVRDTNPANLLTNALGVGIPGTGPLLNVLTPWRNQGSTEVTGVDFEFKMRNSLGEYGKLTSSLKGTYLIHYKHAESPGFPENDVVGTYGGVADWANTLGDIPRLKMRLSSALEMGAHTFTGAMNYVSSISNIRRYDGGQTPPATYSGSTCHYGGTNFDGVSGRTVLGAAATATNGRNLYATYHPDCTVPAWTTYDLGYFYNGVKDLTVGLQISNILDTKAPYAPRFITEGVNPGLHNNTGRYFLMSAGYKFK